MVARVMLRDEMRNEQHQQQAVSETMTTTMMSRRNERRCHRHRLAGQSVARKYQRAAIRRAEYRRLKAIVPSVADKKSVSKVCEQVCCSVQVAIDH